MATAAESINAMHAAADKVAALLRKSGPLNMTGDKGCIWTYQYDPDPDNAFGIKVFGSYPASTVALQPTITSTPGVTSLGALVAEAEAEPDPDVRKPPPPAQAPAPEMPAHPVSS